MFFAASLEATGSSEVIADGCSHMIYFPLLPASNVYPSGLRGRSVLPVQNSVQQFLHRDRCTPQLAGQALRGAWGRSFSMTA